MKLHNKDYKNLGVIILLLLTLTCSVNTKIDDTSPDFESSLPTRQTGKAPLPSPENRQTSNSVPLTIRELSVPNIIEALAPSVVEIATNGRFGPGGGTGLVLDEEGNILKTLNRFLEKVKLNYRIIVVYDYDEDPTIKVVKDNFSEK